MIGTPMSRLTKDEARQQVAVYGDLLRDSAVVEEITTEEVRGEMVYTVRVGGKFPYEISCSGLREAALVLTGMWYAYNNAKTFYGFEADTGIYVDSYVLD